MNIYLKIVLITSISITSAITHSQVLDIKLDCKLNVTKRYASGEVEKEIIEEIFEVTQYKTGELFIIPVSDQFASASTDKRENVTQINNYSNENKWELAVRRVSGQNEVRTRIFIDRNNERIAYTHDFNNGRFLTEANGKCEKIDTKSKKF